MTTLALVAGAAHRRGHHRTRRWTRVAGAALTVPIIYSLAVPLAMLDLWVTAYQALCFPVYRIARVRRRRFFVVDRHRLPYLNAIEKLHCTYCSYATGVLAYTREVAARTEAYWCPIRHQRRVPAPHRLYPEFFAFGDETGYTRGLVNERRRLGSRRTPRP